ncbi:MAG: hypothetical protein ACOX0D_10905 [Sphaerochaeta sp.]|jgi:hypothetical protein
MRNELATMLDSHRSDSPVEAINALKEVIQELVLRALSANRLSPR